MHKYVYLFKEGNGSMRELLGGKGANLAEMTNLGMPVPQGFTITTEACTQYYEDGEKINDDIQAQIMDLIVLLNKKLNMGVILITHDLSVVAETCTRVAVMYLGQIVEEAPVADLFDHPRHPYTIGLMSSIPKLEGEREKRLHIIKGMVPMLHNIPKGCRFAPRCPYATARCAEEMPELIRTPDGRGVRCWNADNLKEGDA